MSAQTTTEPRFPDKPSEQTRISVLGCTSKLITLLIALSLSLLPSFAQKQPENPSAAFDLLFAKQAPDIFFGNPDVLYSQSQFLRSFDESWVAPLSSSAPVAPLADSSRTNSFAVPLPKDKPAADSSTSDILVNPQNQKTSKDSSSHFRWMPAIGESLLYTGIMHSFDLASQAGTRDSLNGHWFQQYAHSVSELRGWSDSDAFMAPYVGHPLEGSIFGFIERQNDPRYRFVQWGDGREYWVSLLRSMAYSAVWHTQWKIGPASEASIANVMLHASPGFICLVDTPTLGFVVMLAEDAADRYLIMGLENRTTNRPLIILARSFLSPGRTFANMMAFRLPWARETRIGLLARIMRSASNLSMITRMDRAKTICLWKLAGCLRMWSSTVHIPRKRILNSLRFLIMRVFWGEDRA